MNTANQRDRAQAAARVGRLLLARAASSSSTSAHPPRPFGVTINLSNEWNHVSLAEGEFSTCLHRAVIDTQFSPFMYLANNIQHDPVSGVLGWQSRFRWIVRLPGNLVVYTHNRIEDQLDPNARFRTPDAAARRRSSTPSASSARAASAQHGAGVARQQQLAVCPDRGDAVGQDAFVERPQRERLALGGTHVVPQLQQRQLSQEVAAVGRIVGGAFGLGPPGAGRWARRSKRSAACSTVHPLVCCWMPEMSRQMRVSASLACAIR
ncbi:MAG: hypothetical protein R2708_09445 [Vicinamibacterales bacterium]